MGLIVANNRKLVALDLEQILHTVSPQPRAVCCAIIENTVLQLGDKKHSLVPLCCMRMTSNILL